MTWARAIPVTHVEILDGGVVLTFADGKGAFLSANLLHRAVIQAEELPEFSAVEQAATMAWWKLSASPERYA
jgi:hypothetical protein